MSPRRYFAAFAASALAAAVGVGGVNCLIDPLGVVPGSRSVRGVNAEKVMRFDNDRVYKPLDLLSARPRTIVLGTSRILGAFDPRTLSGTPYGPAYNYGFPNGYVSESGDHFDKFIARTPSVKYVFVELFLPTPSQERASAGTAHLLVASFFSWSALQQSAETVWQNMRIRSGRAQPGPVVLADGRQSFVEISMLPNFLRYPAFFLRTRPRYEVTPGELGAMRRMREVARSKGITLTFFVSPIHAVQLYTLHTTGHWPVLEEWKRQLAREFDVLDFSAYTPITEEPVSNEMRYWLDPHHFSRLTGRMLVDRLTRREAAADGFGVALAPDRLEDELHIWREARDNWIARNPAWVQLLRLASEDAAIDLPAMDGLPGGTRCPVRVSSAVLSRLTPSRPTQTWLVNSYRTTLDPPIAIGVRTTRPHSGDTDEVCELAIEAAPETPSVRPVDWRIGYPMGSPTGLRGRTVRYTVRIRASTPVALSTGEVYVYDGARTSVAPVTALTREWRTVTVAHTLAPDASRLEVWFRVVLGHGTVRPVGGRIYFNATVDLSPVAPET